MFKKLLIAVFILLFVQNSFAVTKVGQKFGDWTFSCQAQGSNKTTCNISQTIVNKKTRRLALNATLIKKGSDKDFSLIIMTPLGIYIPSGVSAKIDKKLDIPLSLKRCTPKGCIAVAKLTKSRSSKLKSGKKLNVVFYASPGGKPITLDVSLKGASAGLGALK